MDGCTGNARTNLCAANKTKTKKKLKIETELNCKKQLKYIQVKIRAFSLKSYYNITLKRAGLITQTKSTQYTHCGIDTLRSSFFTATATQEDGKVAVKIKQNFCCTDKTDSIEWAHIV